MAGWWIEVLPHQFYVAILFFSPGRNHPPTLSRHVTFHFPSEDRRSREKKEKNNLLSDAGKFRQCKAALFIEHGLYASVGISVCLM